MKKALKNRRMMLESLESRQLLAVLAGAAAIPEATGAELIVNTASDSSTWSTTDSIVSLREAIDVAAAGDVIKFDSSLDGETIELASSTLQISKSVKIDASDLADGISVSGGGSRIVFVIDGSASVEMTNMTVTDGNSRKGSGGGIKVESGSTLTLTDSVVTNCTALGDGGGINNNGTLIITRCTVSENTGGGDGGGITNNGEMRMTDCYVLNNRTEGSEECEGGGIDGNGGWSVISNSVIAGNSASGAGGGINLHWYGKLYMVNSVVYGNTSSLGGGGISVQHNFCQAVVRNSTITGNTAAGNGSGFENNGAPFTLVNSIVAKNYGSDTAGSASDSSNNLIGGDPGFVTAPVFDDFGVLTNADTLNLSLTPNSVAIDAGLNGSAIYSDGSAITLDIAGGTRIVQAWIEPATVDIGAYEYQETINHEAFSTIVTISEDIVDCTDGLISLREAVAYAQVGETVTFDAALEGTTFTLSGKGIDVTKGITIDATAFADGVTVSGNSASRVFNVGGGTSAAPVNMINLKITGGKTAGVDKGAGINNLGTLNLIHCTVTGNVSANDGGGIHNSGTLKMVNSLVTANQAVADGGGISNAGSSTITLYNVTVAGNSAQDEAGGISNAGTAILCNTITAKNFCKTVSANYGMDFSGNAPGTGSANNLIDTDPSFTVAPVFNTSGKLQNAANLDLSLTGTSTAIDNGNNAFAVNPDGSALTVDYVGNPRIYQSWKTEATVDIGAYEYQQQKEVPPVTVTTAQDVVSATDGLVSLREALNLVQIGATVNFDAALDGQTITLAGTQLEINQSVVIDASALANGITINANNASRVISVTADGNAKIINVTITGGVAMEGEGLQRKGGGILNQGVLNMIDCTVTGNSAAAEAGGIFNLTTLTMTDCVITANHCDDCGGGMENYGWASLTNCSLTQNTANSEGGAIESYQSTLYMTGCTVSGNTSAKNGGAIAQKGTATFINTVFFGNYAAGNGGVITTYPGNVTTLRNCTISGNTSAAGAGIQGYGGSNYFIYNSLIVMNFSTNSGEALSSGANMSINGGSALLTSNNLIGVGDKLFAVAPTFNAEGRLSNADTLDLSLTDKSVTAIDNGDNSFAIDMNNSALETDYAGNARIFRSWKTEAVVDIGAYEYQQEINHEFASTIVTIAEDIVDEYDNEISLREAIIYAEAGDTVTFDAALAGATFTVTAGQLDIAKAISIDASDFEDGVIITTNNTSRLFSVTAGSSDAPVTMNNLTLTGAKNASGHGAAVTNSGALLMNDCLVTENTSPGDGAGVNNNGWLTMNRCSITNNTGGGDGGGITNNSNMWLTDCVISGNKLVGDNGAEGGGIDGNGGWSYLTNCVVSGNSATGAGGAINLHYSGCVRLTNTAVYGNHSDVSGGAISIQHSTCQAYLRNSTVTGNSAAGNGSGIDNAGYCSMANSIVALNFNTDISGNSANSENSIINADPGFVVAPVFDGAGNLTNADTLDLSLAEGSAAIDAGNDDYAVDQDGNALIKDLAGNKRITGLAVDIGAYELQQPSPYLVVNTTLDVIDATDGLISLREALLNLDAGETITFAAALDGQTITLAGTQLDVTKDITIDASALVSGITVSGNSASRVFSVEAGVTVEMKALTIANGIALEGEGVAQKGGGILNAGMLTLTDCTLTGNTANAEGGAIFNNRNATLTMTGSMVVNNRSNGCGGAIENYAWASLTNCVITQNSAAGDGGAFESYEATLLMTHCTVSLNRTDANGGAIAQKGNARIINSVFFGNTAAAGGAFAIYPFNTLVLRNCTVAGNTASDGGGINGLWMANGYVYNSIIASNYSTGGGESESYGANVSGTGLLGSVGNLIGGTDAGFTVAPTFDASGNLTNADALDFSLTEQSEAIDNGDNAYAVDQDGNVLTSDFAWNPRIFKSWRPEATVDIGAYEYQHTKEVVTTITVTTALDVVDDSDGLVSLREAVAAAINGSTVDFDASLEGQTITISQGQIDITKAITIDGSAFAEGVTISPNETSRIFYVTAGSGGSPVTMIGLTLTGGKVQSGHGGGVYNTGVLLMTDCTVTGNTAAGDAGGVNNNGSLFMNDCFITNNTGGGDGGGLTNNSNMWLTDCVISGNRLIGDNGAEGGGFDGNGGWSYLTNCVVSGNSATGASGAINLHYGGCVLLTNTAVYGNHSDVSGGAISIQHSTCQAYLRNSTVTGNSAAGNGSGIDNAGYCSMSNSIVALNFNTDISGNSANSENSIISADPGFVVAPVFDEAGNLTNADTLDLTLAKGSAAIDAGNNEKAVNPDDSAIEFDLAGNTRIVNAIVDIGAYEYQGGTAEPLAAPVNVVVSSAGANRKNVSWDAVEYAVSYTVAYSADQVNWTEIAATETTVMVTGLVYGEQVTFKVKAVGDGISYTDSDFSATVAQYVCPMDVDSDGRIGPADRAALSAAWFSRSSSAKWDIRADIDGDGTVGPSDRNYQSQNWMKSASSTSLTYPPALADAVFADDFDTDDTEFTAPSLDVDFDIFS